MKSGCRVSRNVPALVGPGLFPPELIVKIKALACELPATRNLPLSRWSVADVAQQARQSGLVATISDSTVWRWLSEDVIRPGNIAAGSFRVIRTSMSKLDTLSTSTNGYGRADASKTTNSSSLRMRKTSIQARSRRYPTLPTKPGQAMKVEHEYKRCGAWSYLAALDVHRAKLFGRCEEKSGIAEVVAEGGSTKALVTAVCPAKYEGAE